MWQLNNLRLGKSLSSSGSGVTAGNPSLNLNFLGTSTLNPLVTFTRASSGTYFDSTGTLQTAGNNTARFDYNPSTLASRGLLIEEQRTNSIRNNTMVGAVAGTPGTLPTNWGASTALTGLTREIVGTGTENGVTYIDIKLSGTPSASGRYDFYFETSTGVAALNGQTWISSMYYKLQAGSLTGVSALRLYFEEKNSGGGYLTEQNTTITNPTSAALSTQRASATRTLNQATTAFLLPGFNLLLTGVAIDITLRIGLPQLEQGAFATSVIPTTTAAATRSADVASVNTLSPWYNASEGTLFAEAQVETNRNYSGTFRHVAQVSPEANSNSRVSMLVTFNNQFNGEVTDNSSTQASMTTGSNTGAAFKLAIGYKVNDFGFTVNGAAPQTDTSGNPATTPAVTQMMIGRVRDGNVLGQLNGYIRRITYYPRRLPNAALQSLTA